MQKASVTVGLTVMTFLSNLRDFEGNFTQVSESSTRLLTSRQLPLFNVLNDVLVIIFLSTKYAIYHVSR